MIRTNFKSGLTVSLVSIPLSISLAVASGVSPVMGIITAIWAGLIGAFFGGSNYNIIGPTGALSGIIAGYALAFGPEYVPSLAILAGIFIVIAYFLHLELYLIFIPSSAIHGFTLGVACIIALNQLNFALGLHGTARHERFIENVIESFKHIGQTSWQTGLIFVLFLATLFIVRKIIPAIPGAIIISPFAIALGIAATRGVIPLHLDTLGTTFGAIHPLLFQKPTLFFDKQLATTALVIAFVALIETILSAKIADTMTKTKHNARKEVLGLGLANIVSGLVGGIPATAALARTALNVKTGATSNLSAILNGIFIALGSFLFLSYFSYMPMAVIAAMLVYVAVNMVEHEHFERLYRHHKANFLISLVVAFMTVTIDPIIGILAGAVMALLFLVNTLAESFYEATTRETKSIEKEQRAHAASCNVLIYTFKGKLVYLNNQAHIVRFQTEFKNYASIVLALHDLYFIDLDGVDALEEIIETIERRGQKVYIVQPNKHIKNMLASSKEFKLLQKHGLVFESIDDALHVIDSQKEPALLH